MYAPHSRIIAFPPAHAECWLFIQRCGFRVFSTLMILMILQDEAHAESRAEEIQTLLQTAHSRGQFNGTALAGDKGQVVYTGAFGYADFDKKIPLTTDSIF